MTPQNATKHYKYYPDEANVQPYLAYGFRPIFLILPLYLALSMLVWGFVFSGKLNLFSDPLSWHIYEMVFGVGIAGVMAFLFTGLPELFPGVIPIIGKRLKYIITLWILGRISFWMMDIVGVYIVALLNISLWVYVVYWAFKPVVLDPLQRHSSIGYAIVGMIVLQGLFFASKLSIVDIDSLDILKLSLTALMALILLALRRVNMEAINEILEHKNLDDVFVAKPHRYNLAVFSVLLFGFVEFYYPTNSALAWIGLAACAAILGVINDYNLKFEPILKDPFTWYMISIFVMMALGYGLMGISLMFDMGAESHFRHFISTGAFGITFFMVMVIVVYVHTGRVLGSRTWIGVGVLMLIISTLTRALIPLDYEKYNMLIGISMLFWMIPYLLYFYKTRKFLLSPRVDGIKG